MSIPSRIVEIRSGVMPMGTIEVDGQGVDCCLAYVPEAAIGDFVLVQNGFAVELLDPESARQSQEAFRQLGLVCGRAMEEE